MTSLPPQGDDLGWELAGLSVHDATPERAERIRARCLAVLAGRRCAVERSRAGARRASATGWPSWLEPALALGLCALYALVAVGNSVALYR